MTIAESYSSVFARISGSASGREVRLIAVSKGQEIKKIQQLYQLGHRDFGENYAQELEQKAEALREPCPEIRWHFVGHLQKNKAKQVIPWVASVHSVHNLSLALELSKRWEKAGRIGFLPVFIEVNIDIEPTKSGALPADVISLCKDVSEIPGLKLQGLMCIPSSESGNGSNAFDRLRDLELECRPFTQGRLSMGMSDDFEAAIRCGATDVRVGTLIFGKRNG